MTNALSAAKLRAEAAGSALQMQNAAARNTASSLFFNRITPLMIPPHAVMPQAYGGVKINFILAKLHHKTNCFPVKKYRMHKMVFPDGEQCKLFLNRR